MCKWSLTLIVCLLAGVMLGCLEFDEQTVYVEHDQANDRLILIFNYKGLYGGGELKGDEGQLAEALETRTVALVDNWPLATSVPELREALANPDVDLSEGLRRRIGWILDEFTVLNGGFYLDPAGRLCAAQVVIVEDASWTIPSINRATNWAILETEQDEDEPEERLLLDLIRRGHEWFKLDGHALEVSCPLPEEEFAEGREDTAEGLRATVEDVIDEIVAGVEDGVLQEKTKADVEGHLVSLFDLIASPILVWHDDHVLRLRFGYETIPSEIVARVATGKYLPNLEEHVAETYGLHLDANLARYLVEPDAPAETEEQEAARLMAPRLTQRQRARVLVHALKSAPSDTLWAKLREEPAPAGVTITISHQEPSDGKLLAKWQEWLESRPVPRAEE